MGPTDKGVKLTFTVQVPDGANVCPEQESLPFVNWEACVPARDTVPMMRLPVPVLETIKGWAAEVLPTGMLPKSAEEGATDGFGTSVFEGGKKMSSSQTASLPWDALPSFEYIHLKV